jgi:SAM-dependent methyltransferase
VKKLESFGIAGIEFEDSRLARGYTYTTRDDVLVPTNLLPMENPFTKEVLEAKYILDIVCGVGRNTDAIYIGLDPNESMLKFCWDWQDTKWKDRVILCKSYDEIPAGVVFDVVVVTFVFQHIGYRPNEQQMNISDITTEARKFTKDGTIWFLYEHEGEEEWIERWFREQNWQPTVYIRNYTGLPELTHRGGYHHLIIVRETK